MRGRGGREEGEGGREGRERREGGEKRVKVKESIPKISIVRHACN